VFLFGRGNPVWFCQHPIRPEDNDFEQSNLHMSSEGATGAGAGANRNPKPSQKAAQRAAEQLEMPAFWTSLNRQHKSFWFVIL